MAFGIARGARVLWIALVVLLQGCAHNVVFNAAERERAASESASAISVFFDRNGNMYPAHSVPVHGFTTREAKDIADIKAFFRERQDDQYWGALLRDAQVQGSGSFDEVWRAVQEAFFTRTARSIMTAAQAGARRLVFVVHGFNNDYAAAHDWFREVDHAVLHMLREAGEPAPVFVHVHWDGLEQAGIPIGVWRDAQWNAPVVAVALRKLLVRMEQHSTRPLPVTMITHSTGAILAVNATGNGLKPFDCKKDGYEQTCTSIRNDRLPRLDRFRLGLLIPAASPTTFELYEAAAAGPEIIVIGTNRHDSATSKGPLHCGFKGSTCMAIRTADTCRRLRERFGSSPHIKTALFEFGDSTNGYIGKFLLWEDHAMQAQMRREKWQPFLRAVLFADPQGDDSASWCARP